MGERNDANGHGDVLNHRDGHRIEFLDEGADENGEYLRNEQVWTRPGRMIGPHSHPVLSETFFIKEGRMRFRVNGREFVLRPGETYTVRAGQVHQYFKEGEAPLILRQEVRPPLRHRQMYETRHRLDVQRKIIYLGGVPINPLVFGLLWDLSDCYVAVIPRAIQGLVFGRLARLARFLGYADG